MQFVLRCIGWSLGEHGEFCKFENLEVVTRIPLMVYYPGMTDGAKSWKMKWNEAQTFPFIDVLKDPHHPITKGKLSSGLCAKTSGQIVIRCLRRIRTFWRDRLAESLMRLG